MRKITVLMLILISVGTAVSVYVVLVTREGGIEQESSTITRALGCLEITKRFGAFRQFLNLSIKTVILKAYV